MVLPRPMMVLPPSSRHQLSHPSAAHVFEDASVRRGDDPRDRRRAGFRRLSPSGRHGFPRSDATRFDSFEIFLDLTSEIALLPVGAHEQFTSEQMSWIAIERLVDPHDHVVVPTLIPERGRRSARERAPTSSRIRDPAVSARIRASRSTERLHQAAVVEVRFRVIRVDGQGALEASLGGDPIPLAEEHHLSQRHLCVGALIVQRKRAKRGGFGLAERFEVRHVASRSPAQPSRAPGRRMPRRRSDRSSVAAKNADTASDSSKKDPERRCAQPRATSSEASERHGIDSSVDFHRRRLERTGTSAESTHRVAFASS